MRLYLDGIDARQAQTIEYQFILMLRGEVIIPPLQAYRFYTPMPVFEIDGQRAIVIDGEAR